MRRSTAAAVGTVTGAALIMAVRLSAFAQPLAAAPPGLDLSQGEQTAAPRATPTRGAPTDKDRAPAATPSRSRAGGNGGGEDDPAAGGLTDGKFTGKAVRNPYGTVQVAITVSGGRVTNAAASYPTAGNSATINPGAVSQLKQETLAKQSADLNAVSGATYTSKSYVESLQAALDAAGA